MNALKTNKGIFGFPKWLYQIWRVNSIVNIFHFITHLIKSIFWQVVFKPLDVGQIAFEFFIFLVLKLCNKKKAYLLQQIAYDTKIRLLCRLPLFQRYTLLNDF